MHLGAVTFDAHDPATLARFWAELTGGEVIEIRNEVAVRLSDDAATPLLLFLEVPESKTAKNRVHPDLHTDDLEGEVARALGLGATEVERHQQLSRWVVLRDPEGNEFCIVQPPGAPDPDAEFLLT